MNVTSELHGKDAIIVLEKEELTLVEGFLPEGGDSWLRSEAIRVAESLASQGIRPGTASGQYSNFGVMTDLARRLNI